MQRSIIISIILTAVFIHTAYCIPTSREKSSKVFGPDLNHRDESQPSSPALQPSSPAPQPSSPAPPARAAQPIPNLSELIAPGRRPDTPRNPYFRVPDLNLLPIEEAEPQPSSPARATPQTNSSAEAALLVRMGNQRRGAKPILILNPEAPPLEPRAPIRPHAPTSLVVEQRFGEVPRYVHESNAQPRPQPQPQPRFIPQPPQPQPQPRFIPQPPAMGNRGNYLPQLSHTGRMEFVEVINPAMVRPQDVVLTPAQMIGPDRQMINRFVPWAPTGQASGSQPRQASGSQPPPLGNQQRPTVIPVFERNQLVFSESQPPQGRAQGRGSPQGRGSRKDKGKGIQRGG